MTLADVSDPLTLGGFIALASLGLGALGFAVKAGNQNNDLRERIVKLETQMDDHLRNGVKHEGKE